MTESAVKNVQLLFKKVHKAKVGSYLIYIVPHVIIQQTTYHQ